MTTMTISQDHLARVEAKYGKDNPAVQLLRNSRMGQGQTAHDLYVTGSINRPKNEVVTTREGCQGDPQE